MICEGCGKKVERLYDISEECNEKMRNIVLMSFGTTRFLKKELDEFKRILNNEINYTNKVKMEKAKSLPYSPRLTDRLKFDKMAVRISCPHCKREEILYYI